MNCRYKAKTKFNIIKPICNIPQHLSAEIQNLLSDITIDLSITPLLTCFEFAKIAGVTVQQVNDWLEDSNNTGVESVEIRGIIFINIRKLLKQ